jgi:serine/threonine-protein kinase
MVLEQMMTQEYLAPLAEHFELIQIIGYGGMGVCYLAKSHKDQKQYALKVLHPDFQDSSEAIAQLKREARFEQKFYQHPNIVQTLNVLEIENITVKVMGVMLGVTLKDYLTKSNFHRPTLQAYVHSSITRALDCIHGLGIIHCDIKPANIFIEAQGGIRLFDFGIARSVDDTTPLSFSAYSPTYASPRVCEGSVPIVLDDFYGLNMVSAEIIRSSTYGWEEALALRSHEIHAGGSSSSKIKVK